MKNKMILREFQKEDTREMIDIIRKTWHYDEFCSHKVANKLAKVFLYSCLANQTYTKVAVIDNCPIGIIMGKNIARHKCPFRYRIKQMISIISLLLSYEGRQAIHLFRDVDGIDRELLDHCEIDFQGEVSFFAIDENYRGDAVYNTKYQYVDCKKEFVVAEGNSKYKAIDGVLYSKDGKKLIRIPSRRKEVKVEQGCETVESSAFLYGMYDVGTKVWNINCSELQKIELSSTVKNIEFVHDEFYDKLEKKNYYSDKEELDYEKYMLGMDLRNFKICEVSYNGKTINPQNYIKELTKEQNNNGLEEMVNEINMMIK